MVNEAMEDEDQHVYGALEENNNIIEHLTEAKLSNAETKKNRDK